MSYRSKRSFANRLQVAALAVLLSGGFACAVPGIALADASQESQQAALTTTGQGGDELEQAVALGAAYEQTNGTEASSSGTQTSGDVPALESNERDALPANDSVGADNNLAPSEASSDTSVSTDAYGEGVDSPNTFSDDTVPTDDTDNNPVSSDPTDGTYVSPDTNDGMDSADAIDGSSTPAEATSDELSPVDASDGISNDADVADEELSPTDTAGEEQAPADAIVAPDGDTTTPADGTASPADADQASPTADPKDQSAQQQETSVSTASTKQKKASAPAKVSSTTSASSSTNNVITKQTLTTAIVAIETALRARVLITVKDGKTADKTNVVMNTSANNTSQQFRLVKGNGGYYIVNVKSGKVLYVSGGKATKGANVYLSTKDKGTLKAQLWEPEALATGGWVFRSLLNKKMVLDVTDGKVANGTNLRIWVDNGSLRQTFMLRRQNPTVTAGKQVISNGSYYLVAGVGSDKRLDIGSGSSASSTNAQLYDAADINGQRFYARFSSGFYTLRNVVSGLMLSVSSTSPIAGVNVKMAPADGSKAQDWKINVVKGGYQLVNRANNLVLDVYASKTANGTNIRGFYGDKRAAQTWTLTRTSPLADGFYTFTEASTGKNLSTSGTSATSTSVVRTKDSPNLNKRFAVSRVGTGVSGKVEIRSVETARWLADSDTQVVQQKTQDTWRLIWNGKYFLLYNGETYLNFADQDKASVKSGVSAAKFAVKECDLLDEGYIHLKSGLNSALDVCDHSIKAAYIQSNKYANETSQVWLVKKHDDDTYSFINTHSGLALEMTSTSRSDTVRARQSKYSGILKQQWTVSWDSKNGGIVLTSAATGRALSIANNSSQSGTNVLQAAANSAKGQAWHPLDGTVLAMQERIAQVAEQFATDDAHGYSQINRGCGSVITITLRDGSKVRITNSDVDCSEMVRQCLNTVYPQVVIGHLDTRCQDAVLSALGYKRIAYSEANLQRGDVIWMYGHTAIALGDGLLSDAFYDEDHDLYGFQKGDNTKEEVAIRTLNYFAHYDWVYIYRYVG